MPPPFYFTAAWRRRRRVERKGGGRHKERRGKDQESLSPSTATATAQKGQPSQLLWYKRKEEKASWLQGREGGGEKQGWWVPRLAH